MTDPQLFDCATQADDALAAAEAAITAGECIVLPTDTVYGIGAAAFDAKAVQRLLDAKQRGRDMPPPVLIAEPTMLRSLATGLTADGLALAKAFWPYMRRRYSRCRRLGIRVWSAFQNSRSKAGGALPIR